MSGLAQFVFPLERNTWLETWRQAHENSHRPDRDDSPDPAHVRYIGVMSSNYPKTGEDETFVPVDSAAELFRLIPPSYQYVGSQIAGDHQDRGKMAVPYPWGEDHTRVSILACAMVRVLVAFALTQIEEPPEIQALAAKAGESPLLTVQDMHPERWEKPEDLYRWLCDVYYRVHAVNYNHVDTWSRNMDEAVMVGKIVALIFGEFCTPAGKRAFEILTELGGRWPHEWCDGLRNLGNEVGHHEKGMFGESPLFPLWLLAIQQEFEVCARHAVAEHVWTEKFRKEHNRDDE